MRQEFLQLPETERKLYIDQATSTGASRIKPCDLGGCPSTFSPWHSSPPRRSNALNTPTGSLTIPKPP